MNSEKFKIAFFGSSLVSAFWNGAATYYRGIIKALNNLGHEITFFEPDAFERQKHRDIEDPFWASVHVYQPTKEGVSNALELSTDFDIVVKASGVGVFDAFLEKQVLENRQPGQQVIFWDVDAPATLSGIKNNLENPLRELIPEYDMVLTYGGGQPVINAYERWGARRCIPINNGLDADTHFPEQQVKKFEGDLAFLGNRLPDREQRMDTFFFSVAESLPRKRFILGGSGWSDKKMPDNIRYVGHVFTKDHNAFNVSSKAVLNINRDSMAEMGYSPATRVFEAAGAGACLITDYFEGVDLFLEPGKEVLVARDGEDVKKIVEELTPAQAEEIGRAALERVRSEHTYQHRAQKVIRALNQTLSIEKAASV